MDKSQHPQRVTLLAALPVLVASLLWSSSGLFVKLLQVPAPALAFFRVAIPSLALGTILAVKRRPLFRGMTPVLFWLSLSTAARMLCYIAGFQLTSMGNAVLILASWPAFTLIAGALFFGERFRHSDLFLLLLSMVGIVVMYLSKSFSFAWNDLAGMSLVLVSAMLYGGGLPWVRKELQHKSRLEVTYYQNIVGAVLFLPALFLSPPQSVEQIAGASAYGFIVGVAGFVIFYIGLRRLPTVATTILSYAETLFGIALGMVVLGETLSWNILLGGACIVASMVALAFRR